MSDTVKLSIDITRYQMEAWLALEGWHPWQATYTSFPIGSDDASYGVRRELEYVYVTPDGRTYRDARYDDSLLEKECKIDWRDMPDWAINQIMGQL